MLTLLFSKYWIYNSIDVKAAFLLGRCIEREVFINPPKEYRKYSMATENLCL